MDYLYVRTSYSCLCKTNSFTKSSSILSNTEILYEKAEHQAKSLPHSYYNRWIQFCLSFQPNCRVIIDEIFVAEEGQKQFFLVYVPVLGRHVGAVVCTVAPQQEGLGFQGPDTLVSFHAPVNRSV